MEWHSVFLKTQRYTHGNLSDDPQIVMMQNMFPQKTPEPTTHHTQSLAGTVKYYSDKSSSRDDTDSRSESDNEQDNGPPPWKCQCQEVMYYVERQMKKEVRQKKYEVALRDLQIKIQSKKTKLILSPNGLQAH